MTTPAVLILDPHRELAEMAGEVLTARGFGVVVAERFETALFALDTTPTLRVAVCHATLPSDNAEAAPILQEFSDRNHIGLVVISSRPFEDVQGIPPGAVLLAKPFGAVELLDAIARAEAVVDLASAPGFA
jgi:DNA-binding response OmpR family regulator